MFKENMFNHEMLYIWLCVCVCVCVFSDAAACCDAGCREFEGFGTSADGQQPDTRCQGWYKALKCSYSLTT